MQCEGDYSACDDYGGLLTVEVRVVYHYTEVMLCASDAVRDT